MSLYDKYRPKSLDEIMGNEGLVKDLAVFVEGRRPCPSAILFTGPSGCGKTTLAKILAASLGCAPAELRELNSADDRGIDGIRQLIKEIQYKPLWGKTKVWILDEAHKLTNDAQNALLKALESPPDYVYFILCTTDPQQLLKTVLTRCSQFQVESLSLQDTKLLLRKISRAEGVHLEPEAMVNIAKLADGSARQAISMLEIVLTREGDAQKGALANFAENEAQTKELCQALLKTESWSRVSEILQGLKDEPERTRRAVLGYMERVLLNPNSKTTAETAAMIMSHFTEPFFNSGKPGLTLACYEVISGV